MLDHPDIARSLVRRLDAGGQAHLRTARRNGKRVQASAAPRTTPSSCPTRISIRRRRADRRGLWLGRRALHGDLGVVAVGDAADPLVEKLRPKARALKVGPATRTAIEMGPLVTGQQRDRVVGYIDSGDAKGPRWSWTAAAAGSPDTRTGSSSARRCSIA